MTDFSLATLLRPIQPEEFFQNYWERGPLHLLRADEFYYRELLSIENIDDLITRGDARYPAIRLAKGGAFFAPEAYTRNISYGDDSFKGVPDVEKIFTEYLAGATVTLPALHLTWQPLRKLCNQLEVELDHSVYTNAYITPANASGFSAHYDTHEVFVLQIAGLKHWRIYSPPLHLPHHSQSCSPERAGALAEPLMEIELSPGDLLYLPRGYLHSTTTSRSFSAHVTVGITVYTWVELAAELLQSCIAEPRFRRALPAGFASRKELKKTLREGLAELVDSLHGADDPNYDQAVDAFIERVRAARPRTNGTFRADVTSIEPQTQLRVSPGRRYRVFAEAGQTVLTVEGRRVLLPAAALRTLEAMCASTHFIPEALPGNISLEGKLALVRYLHGLAFLEPVT